MSFTTRGLRHASHCRYRLERRHDDVADGRHGAFFAVIPRVIWIIVILVIGWLVASLLQTTVAALLHAVKFNNLADACRLRWVRSEDGRQD